MSILDIVRQTCAKQRLGPVRVVRVRVGRATGVLPDALRFSFEAAREGTPAAGAALEIEEVPVGGRCAGCGAEFSVEERYVLACPACGGGDFTVERGGELQVLDLEVDE